MISATQIIPVNGTRLVYRSSAMYNLMDIAARVASENISVVLSGETGTGKELVARYIHDRSGRTGQFVAANCSAIPEALAESALFGHTRGAFTGAYTNTEGYFGSAHKGTLFLDELADMPLPIQAKLLRVIQEKTYHPVGDVNPHPVDVRIIAATQNGLDNAVEDQSFRQDLFYRVAQISLKVPPLRERTGDVALLANYFAHKLSFTVSGEAVALLESHSWPGNVRELESRIHAATFYSDDAIIQERDLYAADFVPDKFTPPVSTLVDPSRLQLLHNLPFQEATVAFERDYLLAALESCNWNVTKTAKTIGLSRTYVGRRMKFHGLERPHKK